MITEEYSCSAVFVAVTTPDFVDRRRKLIAELEGNKIEVIDGAKFLQDPENAALQIKKALSSSVVSIHLVGRDPAPPIENSEICPVQLQFNVASEKIREGDKRPLFVLMDSWITTPRKDDSKRQKKHYVFFATLLKQQKPIKAFYSYSHDDGTEGIEELKKTLGNLKVNTHALVEWWDHEIPAGAEWNEEIQEALQDSDLFFCLVTKNYTSSEYAVNEELRRAIETKKKLIPILLKTTRLKHTLFEGNNKQLIPKYGDKQRPKPISEWDHPDQAWGIVFDHVNQHVSDLQRSAFEFLGENSRFYYGDDVVNLAKEIAKTVSSIARPKLKPSVVPKSNNENVKEEKPTDSELERGAPESPQIVAPPRWGTESILYPVGVSPQLAKLERFKNLQQCFVEKAILFPFTSYEEACPFVTRVADAVIYFLPDLNTLPGLKDKLSADLEMHRACNLASRRVVISFAAEGIRRLKPDLLSVDPKAIVLNGIAGTEKSVASALFKELQ